MYNYEAIGKAVIANLDIYKTGMESVSMFYPGRTTLTEVLYWQNGYNLLKHLAEEGKKNEDN